MSLPECHSCGAMRSQCIWATYVMLSEPDVNSALHRYHFEKPDQPQLVPDILESLPAFSYHLNAAMGTPLTRSMRSLWLCRMDICNASCTQL